MKSKIGNMKALSLREFLFVLALATKPFYLGQSGTLQLSDFLYVALFGLCSLDGVYSFPSNKEKKWTILFALIIFYQFFINLLWYTITSNIGQSDERFLKFNLYYIFNFIVCLTIFQLFRIIGYKRLLKLYLIGTSLSVAVCYIGIILNYQGNGREKGFFNNPNQLGYFALIIMTIFVVYCKNIKKTYRFVSIFLCLILNIISLSKASIIGAAVLLIVYVIISNDERGTKSSITIIFMIALVTIGIYLVLYSDNELFTNVYHIRAMRRRLFMMQSENDSNLGTGRGYDRLKEIGLLILTGVGEGAFTRFKAASGKELHSMYASTIVSYGLIGFAGYVSLFKSALFSNNKRIFSILAFSGVLLYCITHNGVRNTLLWSLIAMMLLRPFEDDATELANSSDRMTL